MNLNMRLCGDLVLREKCAAVPVITPEILGAMDEMIAMMDAQKGVGLAAPQVGINQRFIIMIDPDAKRAYKMINPRIIEKSENTIVMEEGCLSVLGPDNLPVFADVLRPESVVVEWTDETGAARREKFSGFISRIAQHEIDHLDGILFIDYLSSTKREMVMRKVRKKKV